MVSHQAAALPLAHNVPHPREVIILRFLLELGAVVPGVVPQSVDEPKQVVANLLAIGVGVAQAAQFIHPLVADFLGLG